MNLAIGSIVIEVVQLDGGEMGIEPCVHMIVMKIVTSPEICGLCPSVTHRQFAIRHVIQISRECVNRGGAAGEKAGRFPPPPPSPRCPVS